MRHKREPPADDRGQLPALTPRETGRAVLQPIQEPERELVKPVSAPKHAGFYGPPVSRESPARPSKLAGLWPCMM